jgi:hypothetical protein
MEAVEAFEAQATAFSPEQIQFNAAQFAPTVFSDRYLTFLDGCYRDHLSR